MKQRVLAEAERQYIHVQMPNNNVKKSEYYDAIMKELKIMHGVYSLAKCDPLLLEDNDHFILSIRREGVYELLTTIPFTGGQTLFTSPFLINILFNY